MICGGWGIDTVTKTINKNNNKLWFNKITVWMVYELLIISSNNVLKAIKYVNYEWRTRDLGLERGYTFKSQLCLSPTVQIEARTSIFLSLFQCMTQIWCCFVYRTLSWVVVKTLESPLGCKEIKPVNPKGNQSWIFIGSTDAEAETPILWPANAKSWLIGKDHDALSFNHFILKAGWDGWMASPMWWAWVWVGSWSWWWTGKPNVLQSMGW